MTASTLFKSEFVMSGRKEVGEISLKDDRDIEWTINDIFQYTKEDVSYESSRFDVSGSRWYLSIYPNGETKNNSVGWIGLYLMRENNTSSPPQGACYTFGLKRADGTFEQMEKDLTWVFDEKDTGYGYPGILKRLQLLRRKSELAPSDDLTVTCSLLVNKSQDSFARTDTLSENFSDLFVSKRCCDATLTVKQQEFPVHRCILAARSTVFAAMFEAEMKEKRTGVVDIVDCDPGVFREFLKYLYSGKAENLTGNAFELFKIGDKYDVQELKSACLIFIMANLSAENVLDAVSLGDQFSVHSLKSKTRIFFNKNFSEIVSTAKWLSFMKSDVLLANELLQNIGSEMKQKK